MKAIVYTAVFGRPDALYDPKPAMPRVDKLCYTDMHYSGKTAYKMVTPSLPDGMHRVLRQRQIKIFWPEILDGYDYSLYVDSYARLYKSPQDLVHYLQQQGADIFVLQHPKRTCAYEEARICRKAHLISQGAYDDLVARYQADGYPKNAGLYTCRLVFRRHTDKIRRFSEDWWEEVQKVPRDQISFPYVAWKHQLKIASISCKRGSRDMVYVESHNHRNRHWQKEKQV